jgi:hypothetical protein
MGFLIGVIAAGLVMLLHELVVVIVARRSGIDARLRVGLGTAWWPAASVRDDRKLQLGVIPFGGFAVLPRRSKKRLPRSIALLVGFVASYLAVALIAFAMFQARGITGTRYQVTEVRAGRPAEGKILVGDTILAANDTPIVVGQGTVTEHIDQVAGAPVRLTVQRAGKTGDVTIQPARDEASQRWLIGLVLAPQRISDAGASATRALRYPLTQATRTVKDFGSLATEDTPDAEGPAAIMEAFRRALDPWQTALAHAANVSTWMLMVLLVLDLIRFALLVRRRSAGF